MFRPTGFADLAGKRVGIFGYGVEGRATFRRLEVLTNDIVVVDDAPGVADAVVTSEGGLDELLSCDVVLKSPGIPRRRADVQSLESHGVTVTSSLNLWLHDVDRSRVVAVTGTKGKSTTSALITFFLQSLDEPALLLGNIGAPPYDPDVDTHSGWLVLEVSSFQCVDIDVAPRIVVVTSLGSDHLDWHGSLPEYVNDKLSLTRAAGEHVTLVTDGASLRAVTDQLGGDVTFVEPDATPLAKALRLMGTHSNANVALALRATSLLTGRAPSDVYDRVLERAGQFTPLRGRLTLVGKEIVNGHELRYVDDGLATSALPAIAALEVFADEPVALIVGGFDRGVDYAPLALALGARASRTVVLTIGAAGDRIGAELRGVSPEVTRVSVSSMHEAVVEARASLPDGGVILLSPAAPSFDRYQNWEQRSDDFTAEARTLLSSHESLGGDSNS
ncbi:MAG TPA: UDP-N-acetylmuramoyl-L-alanine--D-glutamate ligase [Acidimicrobiales bacterium]